ncbi:hypothetical protein BJY01DRAFT_211978 [Aspergillus pseudoustus]|uniref:Ankyrin repeat-containing domain protein n=1 Tax=Aspergillus pseudoustus TaxID=1810923 RepID=A0ABR4K8D0_9EURO
MLDNAAEIDAPISGCSGTALYTAVRRGHHAMIRTLLRHGADPNTVPRRERLTP